NAISGERCSPHPHNFTDRIIRPGDQAFFDIIMSFVGYRTCYYRTFSVGRATKPQIAAYKKAREWMDEAIALIKPGVATDRIARALPKTHEMGCDSEVAAAGPVLFAGPGRPVILGHGYGATGRMWDGQRRTLGDRYRLITWDMRGHGRTESPDGARYSTELTVADMRALLASLGVSRAVVGGLSLGGYM